jgi:hypothetical protein
VQKRRRVEKGRKSHLKDLKFKKPIIKGMPFLNAKEKNFSIAFFCKIPYNILKQKPKREN